RLNMDFSFSAIDEAFREEVRAWLAEHLVGEFAELGIGANLGEGEQLETRRAWEQELAVGGWGGMGWASGDGGGAGAVTRARWSPTDQLLRRGAARSHLDDVRNRRAEAALPPPDPRGRRVLVPRVQ